MGLFSKTEYEEKTVTREEATNLLLDKKNKLVRLNPDGTITVKVQKAKISMTDKAEPKDVPMPINIPIEIQTTKLQPDGTSRKVTIRKTRVNRTKPLIAVKHPLGWAFHYLNLEGLQKDGKVRFDRDFAEPVDEEGNFIESKGLKKMLVDSGMTQLSEALTLISGIQIPRSAIYVGIFVGVIGALLMFSFDSLFGLIPQTNIHWLPHKPEGFQR